MCAAAAATCAGEPGTHPWSPAARTGADPTRGPRPSGRRCPCTLWPSGKSWHWMCSTDDASASLSSLGTKSNLPGKNKEQLHQSQLKTTPGNKKKHQRLSSFQGPGEGLTTPCENSTPPRVGKNSTFPTRKPTPSSRACKAAHWAMA